MTLDRENTLYKQIRKSKIDKGLLVAGGIKLPYYILHMMKGDDIVERLIFKKKQDVHNFLEMMRSHSVGGYYDLKMERVEIDCKGCKSIKVIEKKVPYFKDYMSIMANVAEMKLFNKYK